jgi:membrane-associated phospholipid phosphatase
MALMSLITIWPYRLARFALILANTALLPAILIHGGHNLMDVLGGTVITIACWRLGLLAFDAQQRRPLPTATGEALVAGGRVSLHSRKSASLSLGSCVKTKT